MRAENTRVSVYHRFILASLLLAVLGLGIQYIYIQGEGVARTAIKVDTSVLTTFPTCGKDTERTCAAIVESISSAGEQYNCSRHNVFLFSHRRSGTHMAINLLRYGFDSVQVWKMNHASCSNCTLISSLQKCGVLLHAMRNPLDVAVSMYEYVADFDPEARSMTLHDYIATSKVATNWTSYVQNCKSVPGMIHLDFEMSRTAPKAAHELLAQTLGLAGQWNSTSIPTTDATSFKGGRVGGWQSLRDETLRNFLQNSISTDWVEQCSCDKQGIANDGHPCQALITPYL